MLELTFTARDLAYTRFSVSPLWEVVASVQVLKSPGRHPVHHRWVEQVRPRLADLDWRLLSDLVPVPSPVVPGFLAPPRPTLVPDLDLELAALRAVPAAQVRTGLDRLPRPLPRSLTVLAEDPARGLARLAETVQAYWEVALAAYWPRILTLLEGEILHRARLLAEGGAHRLLNDLNPAISWDGGRLRVAHRSTSGMVRLRGRGLLLAPSVFIWPRVASIVVAPWQPTLRYPPRGVGTLWESRHPAVPEPLARVVGRSRA